MREELLMNKQILNKIELGTGAKNKKISISNIAKTSLKYSKEAQLLFKLVNYFQPKTILEIGTSLGLTTSYLAASKSDSEVLTIEGCPNTLAVAIDVFKKLHINNINSYCGNFDDLLPEIVNNVTSLDFVFFDGNHRYLPTINYFTICLQKAHNNSVFIFDDIHWSAEMTKAWNEIKTNSKVTVTIDLFNLGIVFFRKEQVKQHFILKF